MDRVIFIGTAGGRVSVFRLLRRSGGFLLNLSGRWIHVDPGPGSFVYLHQMNFDIRKLDLVVLSHIHLDHSSDVNTIIESATDGGKKRHVALFAPKEAFEGNSRVVLPFIRDRLSVEGFLEEGKELSYLGIKVKAVMKHIHHGADTYALLFNDRVLYVSCALFEERMLEMYPQSVDLMIINTTLYNKVKYIEHLSVDEAKILIKELKPKRAVITHFGWEFLENYDTDKVAQEIYSDTGVKTYAAYDGMVMEL